MKGILIVLTTAAVLTACGKENFADPQKFADHYGHELLDEHFKSGLELMSYKGFEFSNAKVGIDRNGREYVSAQVSLDLSRGAKYYRRLAAQSATDVLKAWPSDKLSRVVRQEDACAISEACRKMRRDGRAPVVYGADAVDIKKLVSPWRMIRIMRLKDGEGVYRPVGDIRHAIEWYDADGSEMSLRSGIPNEPFYTGADGLLSEKAIKQLGAVRDGTPEATQARESYVQRLRDVNAAIERLNVCCATQAEMLAMAPSYVTTNATPNWIWERIQKEKLAGQAKIRNVNRNASDRNREAKDACRNADATLRSLKSQAAKAEKNLSRAKKTLESDTKQLERLTSQAAKSKRNSERSNAKLEQMRERVSSSDPKAVSDAEALLADLKTKIQNAETSLADVQAKQTKTVEEGHAAVADAESEMEKMLNQTQARLQDEYLALKQKSSAELEAAIRDCRQQLGI